MLDKLKPKPPNLGRPKSLILPGLFLTSLCGPPLMAADFSASLNDTQFRHTEEHSTVPMSVIMTIEVDSTSEEEETGQLKVEWYMPGKVFFYRPPSISSYSVNENHNKVYSTRILLDGQTPSLLLGDWLAKGYYKETGQTDWQLIKEIPFRLYTEASERYSYHTYVGDQFIHAFPFPADRYPNKTTFYTSEVEEGSYVAVSAHFNYYYQEPGIGFLSKWYYWKEDEKGNTSRIFYTSNWEPRWTNDPSYSEESYIHRYLGQGLPFQWMIDNKLTGQWDVEIHVSDLSETRGFLLDDKIYFTLEDDVDPEIEIETPDNQETDDEVVPIAVHAKDDIAVVKVTWSTNHGDSGEITSDSEEGITDFLPLVLLEDGDNVITLKAYDKAENESEEASITITRGSEAEDGCFQVFAPGTDPVDAYTGGQILQHDLLTVQGLVPLSFTLGYDSKRLKKGPTGRGWEDKLFGARLEELTNGDIKVHWTTNRYNRFIKQEDGQYLASKPSCQFDRLVKNEAGSFTLTRQQNQRVYQFNAVGQLMALGNSQEQFVNLSYNNQDQLTRVTEPVSGVFLDYAYNPEGLLETVTGPLGRTAQLGYDEHHNLVTITDAAGQTTTYTYYDDGRTKTGVNADNVQLFSNTYDDKGRIIAQQDSNQEVIQLAYEKEAEQRQTTVTNRLGKSRVYTFNNDYRLLNLTDEEGESVDLNYNDQGQRLSSTDGNGNTTAYEYDDNGNLKTITDAKLKQTHLTYDADNNLLEVENALGKKMSFVYENNRLISQTDPLSNVTSYTYNKNGQVITKTTPREGVTRYDYENGYLVQVTNPEGVTHRLGYDAAGRLTTITDAENHTTTLGYDGINRLTSVTNPLGHSTSMTYDSRDNLVTFTDANGNVTHNRYNPNGKLISRTNALEYETRYKYDNDGRLLQTIDAKGRITKRSYDKTGRLTSITNPLNQKQQLEYDGASNLVKHVEALDKSVMSLNYDSLNNPTEVMDALKNTSSFQYDALGRITQTTDPKDRVTQFAYDDLNRLVESVDALQGVSSQSFDADGNRDSLSDPNQNQTQFGFDLSGRLVQETLATGDKVKYTYSARDLLESVTNGRNQQRQFEYDAADRLTRWTDPDGTVSYTYDNNGNVLTVTDKNGTISREYDKLNRVTKYIDTQNNTLQYQYDAVGNLVTLTYPDDKQVHYEYNDADLLIKVTDWANRETVYDYDKNGRVISMLRPNGTQMTRVYDDAGQLKQQKDVLIATGEIISQFDFSYDATGNIIKEQTVPAEPEPQINLEMTYTVANRLATYNDNVVQFDPDGNMRQGPLADGIAHFEFDSRNRLMSVGNTIYRYDAENQRVGISIDGQNTRYVVNSQPPLSQVLVRTKPDGTQTYYVYGLWMIGQEQGNEYLSYHFDLRGSTVALTNETGEITNRFQYSPYGVLLNETVSDIPFLFNGKYGVMTDTSGLYYMRARYYNPEIRRFVNQDILRGNVVEGQTLNRYAYVMGQPVSYVDPFGLSGFDEVAEWTWDFIIGDAIEACVEEPDSVECAVEMAMSLPPGKLAKVCKLAANANKKKGGKKKKKKKRFEEYERYGSETEAILSKQKGGLIPRPKPHHKQPKWIADKGVVRFQTLGKPKKYTHRINIETSVGVRVWLKQFEIKSNEPGRYEIPLEQLDYFNSRITKLTIERVR
jgi:RHS repeat-associated protein